MKDLSQIIQELVNWNNAREDLSVMINCFTGVNCFKLQFPNIVSPTSSFVHAYPGLDNDGILSFYCIQSPFDTKTQFESPQGLMPHIQQCLAINLNIPRMIDSMITPTEAIQRILDWRNNHNQWISNNVSQGLYQAFTIPSSDMSSGVIYNNFFALNDNGVNQTADIILQNEGAPNNFADTVRPVPPFGVGDGTEKSSFFLLNHALSENAVEY